MDSAGAGPKLVTGNALEAVTELVFSIIILTESLPRIETVSGSTDYDTLKPLAVTCCFTSVLEEHPLIVDDARAIPSKNRDVKLTLRTKLMAPRNEMYFHADATQLDANQNASSAAEREPHSIA